MSEDLNTPKGLREAYDRLKAENATLRNDVRGYVLEKAGVPDKARGFVTKALGDDADWSDPESIKNLLTEQGLAFGDSGQQAPATDDKQTPEDKERLAAQSRIDEMRGAGTIPSGAAPSIKDQIAEAEGKGDVQTAMSLKSQQMLTAAGM